MGIVFSLTGNGSAIAIARCGHRKLPGALIWGCKDVGIYCGSRIMEEARREICSLVVLFRMKSLVVGFLVLAGWGKKGIACRATWIPPEDQLSLPLC